MNSQDARPGGAPGRATRRRSYGLNGRRLTLTNDAAYDLVMAVAAGTLDDVEGIAAALTRATTTWV